MPKPLEFKYKREHEATAYLTKLKAVLPRRLQAQITQRDNVYIVAITPRESTQAHEDIYLLRR